VRTGRLGSQQRCHLAETTASAAGLRGLRGEDQSCIEVTAGFDDFHKLFQVLMVLILHDFKGAAQEAGAQAGLH
jgi:hypothetical protein